jgi:hypothetical protein
MSSQVKANILNYILIASLFNLHAKKFYFDILWVDQSLTLVSCLVIVTRHFSSIVDEK